MLALGASAVLGALSLALASAPDPSADDPQGTAVDLKWRAPATCPSGPRVRRWLADALADSTANAEGLQVDARVQQSDSRFALDLSLQRPHGSAALRHIEHTDCVALAKAAVLVIALAVDPTVAAPEPEPEPEPAAAQQSDIEVPTPASPEPEPEPEPEPDDSTREPVPRELLPARSPDDEPTPVLESPFPSSPLHFGLRATAAAGLNVLPEPTAVVSLTAAIWGRAFRAELGASYWTPIQTRPDGEAGARIQQWTVDARGCGLVRPGPVEIPLCGGVDIGAVHGRGLGVLDPRPVRSLRLALTAGAAVIWRPRRWDERVGVWAGGDLLLAVVRARFRTTPSASSRVYHTPWVGGRIGAGIELRFR